MILSFFTSLAVSFLWSSHKKILFLVSLLPVSLFSWLFLAYPDQSNVYGICHPLNWVRFPEDNIKGSQFLGLYLVTFPIGGQSVPIGSPAISVGTIFAVLWSNFLAGFFGFIMGSFISSRFKPILKLGDAMLKGHEVIEP